ncbi:SpoIIE family protein phosphatase [Streptomyces sp. NPDC048664]|uniref:SpoIIE family protein phosphatase n=1 Tax=Streptomyces sp. NPDC048664 TaxID=3154505 RepID=UPI0034339206
MGAIPTQRETGAPAPDPSGPEGPEGVGLATAGDAGAGTVVRTALPGGPSAAGAARRFVRAALAEWARIAEPDTFTERLADDVLVVVSELVTNAVVHAGTDIEVACRLAEAADDPPGLVVEVCDHHPSRVVRDDGVDRPGRPHGYGMPEYGRGLRLVSSLATAWGITYRTGTKTVWARLPLDGGLDGDVGEAYGAYETYGAYASDGGVLEPGRSPADPAGPEAPAFPGSAQGARDRDWRGHGALSFLAEASDLLAGQLDEEMVAALTGQLLVPRLADWCAVWLEDEASGWRGPETAFAPGPRLARVWHGSENRIEELRRTLEKDPPRLPEAVRSRPVPVPWPGEALGPRGATGVALAYRLIAGGRPLGTLVIGRTGLRHFPDEVTGLVEDLSRRVALAIGAARQYARQATISRVLQRGLLPGAVAEIPGLSSSLVYEPLDKGGPSGDFYDIFPAGPGRWCFALGDVQGKGPEAAVVIGLARPWLRLLAREGYAVPEVLDRLNQLLLDDATEASDAAARALVGAGAPLPVADEGPQARFLSLLYGELVPFDGGVRCTLASAGHPLPLLLGPDGAVRPAVLRSQTLLGVIEDVAYGCETFELYRGDTLLCVTDGVTERRSGSRQFDDGDGLAVALAACAGLSAELIARRISGLVHDFAPKPPEDDLALLVLQAG